MNKFLMWAGISVIALGVAQQSVQADEGVYNAQEQAAVHYEAIEMESTQQAFQMLGEKTAQIAKILKKEGELEFTELESIHEITYTLEASVDKLRDERAVDEAEIDTLDEAVQAIHFASENQEEAKVREWFAKLEPAAGEVSNTAANTIVPAAGEADVALKEIQPVKKEFYEIIIKDHKFSPEEIIVPAGEKIKLRVDNQDPTPEEFESHDMNREKIIRGNKTATIYVGPLKPGKYHFFGEFNMDTANGYIIAK